MDFYVARRASLSDSFGPSTAVVELNTSFNDEDFRPSPDRRHAVFSSEREGGGDLFEVTR
jgi:Tol biopolymer transport system component